MKACIITFHRAINYGALLQTFALQTALEKYFDKVEVLDYTPNFIKDQNRIIHYNNLKGMLSSIYSARSYSQKKKKFTCFIKNFIKLTLKYDSKQAYDFDHVFVGSDQIWNPRITKGVDSIFFGEINAPKAKIISYAASIGEKNLTQDECNSIKNKLHNIDYISVREQEAKEILENLTEKSIDVVCDPTLLTDCTVWKPFIRDVKHSNYLLVYNLSNNVSLRNKAKQIADSKNLELIEIVGTRRRINEKKYKHKMLYAAGIEEFLSYFSQASFVVTDSFHGTAFSLIFNKQFISVINGTRGGRIRGLLGQLGLGERLLDGEEIPSCFKKIDYEKINIQLGQIKTNSLEFIERAIREHNGN